MSKMQGKKYHFVGDGFVPGLPKEITDEEAKVLGVDELLKEAVKAGLYKKIKKKSAVKAEED